MKDLVWYDKLQYAAMLLMAASMPVSFHLGLVAALTLAGASAVKIVASRHIGNASLPWSLRIPLLALVAYGLLHLVSVAYGGDVAVGMRVVELKAVLLIFPLCFLLTDTSILSLRRIRWLFCALLLSVVCMFFWNLGNGIVRSNAGESVTWVWGEGFDPRHHAYVSLYVDIALSFVATELVVRWDALKRWHRGLLIAAVPLCMLYVLMVNSRAGVLLMWAVGIVSVLWLAFGRRRWLAAAIVAVLFSGYAVGVASLLPGHSNRIQSTIEVVSDESDNTDTRVRINKSAVTLALERPVVGYGVGSYRALLRNQFVDDGYGYCAESEYNAHNQYVETVLAVGCVGLAVFLAFLLLPLYQAWRQRRHLLQVLLISMVVCANLLFESMLERQMGLLFIGFFMSLTVLLINTEENKFGQLPEK